MNVWILPNFLLAPVAVTLGEGHSNFYVCMTLKQSPNVSSFMTLVVKVSEKCQCFILFQISHQYVHMTLTLGEGHSNWHVWQSVNIHFKNISAGPEFQNLIWSLRYQKAWPETNITCQVMDFLWDVPHNHFSRMSTDNICICWVRSHQDPFTQKRNRNIWSLRRDRKFFTWTNTCDISFE